MSVASSRSPLATSCRLVSEQPDGLWVTYVPFHSRTAMTDETVKNESASAKVKPPPAHVSHARPARAGTHHSAARINQDAHVRLAATTTRDRSTPPTHISRGIQRRIHGAVVAQLEHRLAMAQLSADEERTRRDRRLRSGRISAATRPEAAALAARRSRTTSSAT